MLDYDQLILVWDVFLMLFLELVILDHLQFHIHILSQDSYETISEAPIAQLPQKLPVL